MKVKTDIGFLLNDNEHRFIKQKEPIMLQVQEDIENKKQMHFLMEGFPVGLKQYKEEFPRFPKAFSIPVEMGEFTIFPDIITKPYIMVSEMVYEVMRMYCVELPRRNVFLADQKSNQFKLYKLFYPEETIQDVYQDFRLRQVSEGVLHCEVSLAFAESMLRRGARGITLTEGRD